MLSSDGRGTERETDRDRETETDRDREMGGRAERWRVRHR